MPREKRKPKGDYLIGFGKKAGKTFNQIRGTSYRYIVWLSGKVQDDSCEFGDVDRVIAKRIGTKSQLEATKEESRPGQPYCLHCQVSSHGEDDGINQCDLAGETLEATIQNMEQHSNCQLMRRRFGLYTGWKKVWDKHPDAVQAARDYLAINQLCYHCGRTTSPDVPLPLCKGHG